MSSILVSSSEYCFTESWKSALSDLFEVELAIGWQESLALLEKRSFALFVFDSRYLYSSTARAFFEIKNRSPETRLLVISTAKGDYYIDAFRYGADGWYKDAKNVTLLAKAAKTILDGEIWIERRMNLLLMKSIVSNEALLADGYSADSKPTNQILTKLTSRELEVTHFIREGYNNKRIAKTLDISERTVKAHLSSIFTKLKIPDRLKLAIFLRAMPSPVSTGKERPSAGSPLPSSSAVAQQDQRT